jgi:sialic acid synthase SpsE
MAIIAEIGQNHNGDMDLAKKLIFLAKENGADVAKFQVYNARELFPRENNPWFDYNCKTELSREQVRFLAQQCRAVGIEFMASVFDAERVAWLEEVGVKRYKVASRSIRDKALIEAVCGTNKPIIVSLGMWEGNDFPRIFSSSTVDFLYCVSKYPASLSDLRLGGVDFNKYSGFSDHSEGTAASKVALSRGARIIEKHFTMDKTLYGPDHSCSMTPGELKELSDFASALKECL